MRYPVNMGRPKEHDTETGEALLDTCEKIIQADGMAGLSVRRVADQTGTTTRAVYAVFGSKEGLIVALGKRAFDLLGRAMDELPASNDPARDLVEAGVLVFRRLTVDHPALFKIGVQHRDVPVHLMGQFRSAARSALRRLHLRFERLHEHDALGRGSIDEEACQFHALCEGLAALEMRGLLPPGHEERMWREALSALIDGYRSQRALKGPSQE
ncbi:TetR/AcrR family transcriptional regulator [Mesorhizobium sp. WSM2239]|uniref:TetR/AcrR family transcriptional regulator n=2 Tax=unclassified Mesorhizobium TaxID=325217 RepID=A0AAU8D6E7_9HYPH